MGHGHGHGHGSGHGSGQGSGQGSGHAAGRRADRSRLRWVLAVTATVLVVELVGAAVSGSLALLADAAHMATDAGAVVLALGASYVASLRPGKRSTFGYHRAEVLAALANAVVLLGVCGFLAWEGISRLADPAAVEPVPLIAFAAVGLVANAVSMTILARSDSGSINLRGAANEVLADLLGSLLAVAAGVVVLLTGWDRADPVASLVIAVLIVPRAVSLARDAGAVLLEVAPEGLDLEAVDHHLRHVEGVVDVHDLHAWTITSGIPSLSAHVTVTDEALAARGVGPVLDELGACVTAHFEVRHATFQVEPVSHGAHEDLGDLH